ncbi:MAG: glycosyltransferase [Chryseolinea sp.]
MKKVKVLHVLETVGSGGVEQRRFLMAKYLDRNYYEQKVICTQTKGPLADEMRKLGTEVIAIGKFPSLLSFGHYLKVLKIIKSFKPQIIHGAVFEGVTMAAIAGAIGKVPIVITEETSDPQNRSWRGHFLAKILTNVADYVVGISPSVTNYLKSNGVPTRKIRLINNGVAVPSLIEEKDTGLLREQLGLKSEDFVIGSVGRLRNFHKRFSDLIEAVAMLKNEIPLKLLIIGDGPDKQLLQNLAAERGVSDKVIFAGFQFNTAPFYACMNVFALASHMEGFGLVVVEAMLSNLPVIATQVGGIPDVVVPNKTGFLVDSHCPQCFADKFKTLYVDLTLRKTMGVAGYKRASEEYTADVYIKKVDALYREAVNKKNIKFGDDL